MIRHHRITVAIVLTLALTASLTPIALADPAPLARAEAAIAASHGSAVVPAKPAEQAATAAPNSGPCSEGCSGGAASYGLTPSVVRVTGHSGGFGWRDAGIGAAASLLLVGIGLAGILAATNGRRRRTREQRAMATS
jgi:hypothetical protein